MGDGDGYAEEQAWRCEACAGVVAQGEESEAPLYECGGCGTRFNRDNSADGGSHRCPECKRFGTKLDERSCPECGEGPLEEVDAWRCATCAELFDDEGQAGLHLAEHEGAGGAAEPEGPPGTPSRSPTGWGTPPRLWLPDERAVRAEVEAELRALEAEGLARGGWRWLPDLAWSASVTTDEPHPQADVERDGRDDLYVKLWRYRDSEAPDGPPLYVACLHARVPGDDVSLEQAEIWKGESLGEVLREAEHLALRVWRAAPAGRPPLRIAPRP